MPPAWRAAWNGLAARERAMVVLALGLVALALFWWLLVAPALETLRGAEAQHRALDAQLGRMRNLQQQARGLQAQPRQNGEESLRQLEATVRQRLGTGARMVVAGERVTLTLTNIQAEDLAAFLSQARVNARALPNEARLTRGASGGWDGTMVLTLPPR